MGKYDDCDFSGYVAKYGVLCDDGTKIAKGAFADQDGKTIPLVWNHSHDNLNNVIGHCALEEREDGLYGYSYLNDETDLGKAAKVRVKHGDLTSYSIWANRLRKAGRNAKDILHGLVKEVSLVVAGADPTAIIDTVLAHGVDNDENGDYLVFMPGEEEGSFVMHSSYYNGDMTAEELKMINGDDGEAKTEEIQHSAEPETAPVNTKPVKGPLFTIEPKAPAPQSNVESQPAAPSTEEIAHAAQADTSDPTFSEVFKTLNEEQKRLFISAVAYEQEKNQNDDGGIIMHNVFNGNAAEQIDENNIMHSSNDKKRAEYFGKAMSTGEKYDSAKEGFMAHAAEYGIDNIEILFPEAQAITKTPDFIKRRTDWVTAVLDGANHVPFSKVKSWFADITEDEARAKGYIKGNRKKEEVFKVLKRETSPTTVYKKQKIDRDDWKDITTLDALVWFKAEMRLMLDEELAVAMLIGDGRSLDNDDKIDEEKIRPIWTDDELFTVVVPVSVSGSADEETKAKALIRALIKYRKLYYGSGNATFFTTEDSLADMLLIDDGIGHPLYPTTTQLQTRIRASKIETVQPMDGRSRVVNGKTHFLAGILVNMKDYAVGADKGGKVDFFEDFDIHYNQHYALLETRCSGALTKAYSAMVFEYVYDLILVVTPSSQASVYYGKAVSAIQENDVIVNDKSVSGTLKYVTGWTEAWGSDPAENSGNFLALDITVTPGSYNTVQTIGGFHDERVGEFGEDRYLVTHIKDNAQKIIIKSYINRGEAGEQVITKTLSCSGLKLNKA